jgi:hypothetical protein
VFRLLSFLAAFGILVLFDGQAGAALARQSADPADVQMTPADGTQRHAVAGPSAPYPAWLLLPPGAHIVNGFVFDITPTQGGGALMIAVGGDGQALVAAWGTRLRAAGFTERLDDDPTRCTIGALPGLSMSSPPPAAASRSASTPTTSSCFSGSAIRADPNRPTIRL